MTTINRTAKNENLDLAFESIDSCFGYVEYIDSQIHKLLALYNRNEFDAANQALVEVVELMDLYVQLMTKIYSTFRMELPNIPSKDQVTQNLELHLLGVMKSILQAKEKNDIIMLCDLLEYELLDNLNQWKTKILPELKLLKKY